MNVSSSAVGEGVCANAGLSARHTPIVIIAQGTQVSAHGFSNDIRMGSRYGCTVYQCVSDPSGRL